MRLVFYNMRYATGTGPSFHWPLPFSGYFRNTNRQLAELIQFFEAQKADILALVEIDAGSYRTGHRCQAETIARHLGKRHICRTKYSYLSWWSRMPLMRKQANACLAHGPILRRRTHFLRNGVKRLVMEVELEEVVLYLVHLALGRRCRATQLAELARLARQTRKPYLIAGDFNAFAGRKELHNFMQALGLGSANRLNLPTFPSRAPRWQLDFILHSPAIHIRRFEVARHIRLSDHLPLICDFEIKPSAATASA